MGSPPSAMQFVIFLLHGSTNSSNYTVGGIFTSKNYWEEICEKDGGKRRPTQQGVPRPPGWEARLLPLWTRPRWPPSGGRGGPVPMFPSLLAPTTLQLIWMHIGILGCYWSNLPRYILLDNYALFSIHWTPFIFKHFYSVGFGYEQTQGNNQRRLKWWLVYHLGVSDKFY